VVDLPEGTTLEATDAVVRQFESLSAHRARESPSYRHLRGHGLTHRLQRTGAPLLSQRRRSSGRHPRQPGRQGTDGNSRVTPSCLRLEKRSGEDRGSPTRPISSLWKHRPARRYSPRWWPKSTADRDIPTGRLIEGAAHMQTGSWRQNHSSPTSTTPLTADRAAHRFCCGQGEGRPTRGVHPADHPDPAHRSVRVIPRQRCTCQWSASR
jgi:hypothetical protein